MKHKFFLILIVLTCASFLRAQVWTNYINGIQMSPAPDINCAVEDSVNQCVFFGGRFNTINQFTTNAIIKFDGYTFDTLQGGLDGDWPGNWISNIRDMVMYKNKLFVFGNFTRAGSRYSPQMAIWNGSSWDSLRVSGLPDFAYIKNDELYVWGLDTIEGIKINGLARFDGNAWFDVPTPHTAGHTADFVIDFQGTLYKSGQVTPSSSDANLSYSDGTNWIPWVGISGDGNKAVFGMKVIDSLLFVYGRFSSIAGTQCAGLAAYNGTHWYGFGQGIGTNGGWETVYNIQKINGELYITGNFDKIEGISNSDFSQFQSTDIAKFDGEKWCILNTPFNNTVTGVIKFKNELYVYGLFEKIGNDTIRSFGKYSGGFSDLCSQPIAITMSTVGINENELDFLNLKIYPNPVKEQLHLECDGFSERTIHLELTNSLGQLIHSRYDLNQNEQIDLSDAPNGIYFLRLYTNSGQRVFKVFKE